MAILWALGLVAVGFLLLYYGGDYMVVGAVRLAARLGVEPVVIGLTVVALGTSLPELLVSLLSAIQGHCAVAVGNILGSDVFNLSLIVGVSALLANPLEGSVSIAGRDMKILILGMLLFGILGWDLKFTRFDGVVLMLFFSIYMTWTIIDPIPHEPPPELLEALEDIDDLEHAGGHEGISVERAKEQLAAESVVKEIVIGMVALPLGAHLLVEGGVDLARMAHISERFIAMTLVSWGTSLPEMATSLSAAYHGHSGLCIGNVVGSNLFNTIAIMGITSVVKVVDVEPVSMSEDFVLACVATLLLAFLHRGGRDISRRGGVLLLLCFLSMFVLLGK